MPKPRTLGQRVVRFKIAPGPRKPTAREIAERVRAKAKPTKPPKQREDEQ